MDKLAKCTLREGIPLDAPPLQNKWLIACEKVH